MLQLAEADGVEYIVATPHVFSKLNIEKERQAEINQDIKLQLSSIEGKLDIIIKGIN